NHLRESRTARDSTPPARSEQPPQGEKPVQNPTPANTAGDSTATASRQAESSPSTSDTADTPTGNVMLPARSSGRTASSEDDTARALAPKASARTAQTSEERMADFLIEQLGPESAAAKAQSTAAWYDSGRSEYGYWQRVGEAIRRRTGS